MQLKTGILGGTFNPVHFGHLRIAEETREALNLDKIIFIPCSIPPHKEDMTVASAADRIEMLTLAVKDNPRFEISDMELKRGGKSYSIETIKEMKLLHNDSDEIFFIIGMDSYLEIGIWKNYGELFSLSDFIVVRRPAERANEEIVNPVNLLPVDIRGDFCYDAAGKVMKHGSGYFTRFLETTMLDISSTRLRGNIADGKSIKYLVPEEVENYIKEKELYKGKL